MDLIKKLDLKKVFFVVPIVLIVLILLYTVAVKIQTSRKVSSYVAEYQKLQKQDQDGDDEKDGNTSYYSSKAKGTALVKFVNDYNQKRLKYLQDKQHAELDEVDLTDAEQALIQTESVYDSYVFDESSQLSDWSMISTSSETASDSALGTWELMTPYITHDVKSPVLFVCYVKDALVCVATAEYDGETEKFGSFLFSPTANSMIYHSDGCVFGKYSNFKDGTPRLLIKHLLKDDSKSYEGQGEKSYVVSLFPDGSYRSDDDTMTDGFMVFYEDKTSEENADETTEELDGSGTEKEKSSDVSSEKTDDRKEETTEVEQKESDSSSEELSESSESTTRSEKKEEH